MVTPQPAAVLHTDRLLLKPVLADARLYQDVPREPPASNETLRSRYVYLERRRSPAGIEAWLNWAIRLRRSGEVVRTLEATVSIGAPASVAYAVAVPHQRRGYAGEWVARVIEPPRDRFRRRGHRGRGRYPQRGHHRAAGAPRFQPRRAAPGSRLLQG
jgi:hypothetical protein